VPAGSAVITGSAQYVVFGTGPGSSLGKIASLVEGVHREGSVLERQIAQLSHMTAVMAVLAGAATLSLTQLLTATDFTTALTFATGVIVALVPEGLLPTLSVSLAIGARRMASRGAAVRRLSAIEITGSVTVVCTDKTGTLTENSVRVLGATAARSAKFADLLRIAVLCNDAERVDDCYVGEPLDVALLRWAESQGLKPEEARSVYPRLDCTPFESQRRYMSVTCEIDGQKQTLVKGAPESVAMLMHMNLEAAMLAALNDATASGERVLLFARQAEAGGGEILGVVRFADPPRQGVAAAVEACRRAGIRILMVTGDHPSTARALAQAINLGDDICVVLGSELAQMDDGSLASVLRRDVIFARIDPSQKFRIVTRLQDLGEVVVVTGDGINDAPALRAADVGIAMGRGGTEIAKQAADVVLADNNFATIVASIEEGRAIKANIRRFTGYVFTSNVAELAPFLLFIFLPIPLPLTIIQVLAIDLGTDLLPALALGTEAASPAAMATPPESQRAPLMRRTLLLRTFFYGAIEACLGLGAFFAYYASQGWRPFEPMDTDLAKAASTLTFLGIVAGQIGCLFAWRDGSLHQRLSLRGNPWIAAGLAFEVSLVIALIYVPGLNRLFSMTAVPIFWLAVLPLGAAVFNACDLLRRRLSPLVESVP
jgi:calcium-translocating P-type ATPase